MKKLIVFGIVLGVLLVGGFIAYAMRPPAQASQPIQAVPLSSPSPVQATAVESGIFPPAGQNPTAAVESATALPPAQTPVSSNPIVYEIIQAESQVSFSVDEILRGEPFTAVGTTDQVAGEIQVDFEQASAQLGLIQVNARTLKTDNQFRDRAIANQILQTGQYEYITFTPRELSGIPGSGEFGKPITFQVTGDLTIRDITHPVTFEVTVTFDSKDRMEGKASATVLRSDYNLVIPSVPQVADVSDEVLLEIAFVATPK